MPETRALQPRRQAADTREARTDLALEDNPKYAGAHFAALRRILDREEADYAQ